MSISQRIPAAFVHLVDDAAIFPPGSASLPDAVRAHVDHRAADHADLVGPFVVDAARLEDLAELAPDGFRISVVVPSPAEVGRVAERTTRGGLELDSVEVRLPEGASGPAQVAAIARSLPGVLAYVEAPRPGAPAWPAVRAAVAEHGLRLKFRTGGTDASAFPTAVELATWIGGAVDEGLPFKCTAGLHRAVRHSAPETGFEHHGHLNVLHATALAAGGADVDEVVRALGQRDPAALVDALPPEPALAAARRSFGSFGSCSVLEPLEDLQALGLVDGATAGQLR